MTGKEELKRLAYENACCRCQYYENEKCNNKDTCVWKQIIQDLEKLEKLEKIIKEIKDTYDKNYDIAMAAWYKSIGLTKLLEVYKNE